jgi:hypothetical protein
MKRGAPRSLHYVLTYNGEVIEYQTIFHKISFKSKLQIIEEFGHNLSIVPKLLKSTI